MIGGGICGASVASFLAEEGLSVALFESTAIAAAASGRNSGVLQHPFDAHLAGLYRESLALYRELAAGDLGLTLPSEPAGLLLLNADGAAVAAATTSVALRAPELAPELVEPRSLARIEPALARGLWACRLATGHPVDPAAATRAMAERALRAGASLRIGSVVESVLVEEGRVSGVAVAGGGGIVGCGQVVAAAGPWTTQLIRRWSGSGLIRSVWGVVVSASLLDPPRHVLEELGIDRPGQPPEEMFSLVTVEGRSSVGSTFLTERPEPMDRVGRIMARAAEFVPGLATLAPAGVRACARPVSFDGRPFIGAIGGIEGLFVCAGHGPWGISTGPASARRLADLMLGRADVDPVFSPMRAVTS